MRRLLMENTREIRGTKLKSYDGVVTPTNMMNMAGNRRYRQFLDPYASDSSDSSSPLMRFLRSVDPASPGASTPSTFVTPVKVEEDVIVMDGISLPKSNKGSGEVRMRLPFSSNSVISSSFRKSNSNPTSSSSGSGGRRIGAENSKSLKTRLCHFWETSGICQFGSECQFVHGKEELRPNRYSGKIKHEISKLSSSLDGSPYGSKFPRNSQIKAVTAAGSEVSLPSLPAEMAVPASPIPAKTMAPPLPTEMVVSASPIPAKTMTPPLATEMAVPASLIPAKTIPSCSAIQDTTLPLSDWTPQIDNIKVSLPSDLTAGKISSKEDVDAYIEKVLYGKGTNAKKRLHVFVDICPGY